MSTYHDDAAAHRFEWIEPEGITFADYKIEHGGARAILHVETPAPLRGRGAAKALMDAIVSQARVEGFKLRAHCPYAVSYAKRYAETQDVFV